MGLEQWLKDNKDNTQHASVCPMFLPSGQHIDGLASSKIVEEKGQQWTHHLHGGASQEHAEGWTEERWLGERMSQAHTLASCRTAGQVDAPSNTFPSFHRKGYAKHAPPL